MYRRKYEHDYKVTVTSGENLDGSIGLPIESMNTFLVSKGDKVCFYDVDSYKEQPEYRIEIKLLPSGTREPNSIIAMQVSQCERYLAVISGKNLVMNEQWPGQLFVFRRGPDQRTTTIGRSEKRKERRKPGRFELIKRIVLADRAADFDKISMQFCFMLPEEGKEPNTLFFAREGTLIALNFQTEVVSQIL